ncbi:hypothetical protein CWI37_0768p0010 [Hamiltosporidium tvaerminnensis]|uniref:Uncharacterized protein n=1 Tax=Hamiltosporidium tvaerminnensis TaxID=1176355 RepID=A0A4Q9L1G7_9MICR|nr:hypothetical protein CWI37_0768p0010 [Hamiltosporidium tvaerminnensis]
MLAFSVLSIISWKIFILYSKFNKTSHFNKPQTMNTMIFEFIKYFVEASENNCERLSTFTEQVYLKFVFDSKYNTTNLCLLDVFDRYKKMQFSVSCLFSSPFKPQISFSSIGCFTIKFLEKGLIFYKKEFLTEKDLPGKKIIWDYSSLKYILNYFRIYLKILDRFRNRHQKSFVSLIFSEYPHRILNNSISKKFIKFFSGNGETYLFVFKKVDITLNFLLENLQNTAFKHTIGIYTLEIPRDSYRNLRDKLFIYFYKLCIYNKINIDYNFLKKIDKVLYRVINNHIGITTNEPPNIIFSENYIQYFKKLDNKPNDFFLEDYMYVQPRCLYLRKRYNHDSETDESFVIDAQRIYKFYHEKISLTFLHFHLWFAEFTDRSKILRKFPEIKSLATMCKCSFGSYILQKNFLLDFGFNSSGECVFMYINNTDEKYSVVDSAIFYKKLEETMSRIKKIMYFSGDFT